MKTLEKKHKKIVGETFKKWRKQEKILQKSIAEALGYKHVSSAQKIEEGNINLTVASFIELCEKLGKDPRNFISLLLEEIEKKV